MHIQILQDHSKHIKDKWYTYDILPGWYYAFRSALFHTQIYNQAYFDFTK